VRPGEFHWFNCVENCSALEVYYPEMLSEDIVRRSVGGKTKNLSNLNYPDLHTYAMTAVEAAISPCCNVCDIDPMTNKCRGCDRTLAEIKAFGEGYNK
jgi:hypothetical protein